ncbi:MAG: M90 family metallopeptidase [Verrucomicrobiota bacterium]
MIGLWIFLGGVAAVLLLVGWHSRKRSRRRESLRRQPLSREESQIIAEHFGLWERIPEAIQNETAGWVRVFLDEKSFEACGELEEVTHEMKVTIAAQACLLIARRPHDFYERLKSVLVYPAAYRARDEHGDEDMRLGESWGTGSVVLGWQSVVQGAADPRDGLNVVLHEFAHQLDQEDGVADGVPELEEVEDYGIWSRAFAPAYEDFCERVEQGKRTVLDDYGATNPAEFFAVATETFFEKASQMAKEEPEVYAALVDFYGMDPSGWTR